MDLFQILIATLVGTTTMTAFSYLISITANKLYKEPIILNYILTLLRINLSDSKQEFAGWVLHYLIGFTFVVAYDILWRYVIEFSFLSTIIFGMISGIIGILGWIILFDIPAYQLNIDYKSFFFQLFFAHIIFALGVMFVYNIFLKN